MADATGEGKESPLRVAFDRRIKLEFHGAQDHLGWWAARLSRAGRRLRPDRDGRVEHLPRVGAEGTFATGCSACCGRRSTAGSPATKTSTMPSGSPAIRRCAPSSAARAWTDRRPRPARWAASRPSGWRREANLAALTDLSGAWIDRVHGRRPPDGIILDMDSSESPTHGEQEGSAWNGHFGCTCYHPLFVFNQFGDLERCVLRPGNVHSAEGWRAVLEPVIARYRERGLDALLPRRRGVRQARALRAAGRLRVSATPSGCRPTKSCRSGSVTC